MWEIRDQTGSIHSGTEADMDTAWDVLVGGELTEYVSDKTEEDSNLNPEDLMDTYEKYWTSWKGDLKLVQIHKIHR